VSVIARSGAIALSGHCGSEDAEPLLQQLLANPDAPIDWSECEDAHTAVVQLVMACGRPLFGSPKDSFLRQWVEPMLVAR
jgi:hypothetical protein